MIYAFKYRQQIRGTCEVCPWEGTWYPQDSEAWRARDQLDTHLASKAHQTRLTELRDSGALYKPPFVNKRG